ncbi:MAG: MBL fold metallo-hydrolase [SAR324 cluster bacterium]|nr:MBL fold metallo-hydrolase [SAR324 cluster bacterium]
MKNIQAIFVLMVSLCICNSWTFGRELKAYVPVFPRELEKSFNVDPNKGYLIKEIRKDVYILTDGIYQSAVITSGKKVILIDAPLSLGKNIKKAVSEVTNKEIGSLIYTHTHTDHIAGSQFLADIKGLNIIADEQAQKYLKEIKDPTRLLPTEIIRNKKLTIKAGSLKIQLNSMHNYHSSDGDLFVYIPERKFLMVIDVLAPGYVPFKGLDLTTNVHGYRKIFDTILSYDFDIFLGGHLTRLGGRKDVEVAKAYVEDLYQTVKRIHNSTDISASMCNTARAVGWNNKYLLFKVFLDEVTTKATKEIEARWIEKLGGVDVWAKSHVETMLVYVRWD